MSPSLRPIVLSITLVLAGCAGPLAKWDGSAQRAAQAETLLRTGDYDGARRIFQQLADTSRQRDYYLLRAADAALRQGDAVSAGRLAVGVNPNELEPVDRNQYLLLQARLDLSAGRSREAMARLDAVAVDRLEGGQPLNYHTLRASAYNQLGLMLESARERVLAGQSLTQPEAIEKNDQAIYEALAPLPDPVLAKAQSPDTFGGWVALVRMLKATAPAALPTAVADWRRRYPGHPADGAFLTAALKQKGGAVKVMPLGPAGAQAPAGGVPPEGAAAPAGPFIGVLLPLSGDFAAAAEAIRSGLLAAYYADPDPAKPPLRFVDSRSGPVADLYRKLVGEGAQAVVGPLIKEDLAALARTGDLPVPVLGLNQTPEASHDRLYQFGLIPEQEVEQAAGSAWFDGRQNALVLAPSSKFGQRMVRHFQDYWNSLGGRVAAVENYAYHGQDFATAVKNLVARAAPAAAVPAPPGGPAADFILLIADGRDAHGILPQLATQAGGRLPVYANAGVYGGRFDPQADQDLDGLVFCDVPWLLHPDDGGPLSPQALAAQIQATPQDSLKLIALGLDAYRLVPEIDRMKFDPQYRYPGATGALSMQAGNRIQRQLECAEFSGGVPRPRGIAPVLQPGGIPAGVR
jgi:outer membrane PBP1 activator LpoA protein